MGVTMVHLLIERVPVISATQKGPIVNLVAWISITIMFLSVVTVLISKMVMLGKLQLTDLIISSAMAFSICFIVTINIQVDNGLGSLRTTVTDTEYVSFQKAGYASHVLFTLGLFFGKASTLGLLVTLSPNTQYRLPILIVAYVTLFWAVASVLGSLFQCATPRPWLYTSGVCVDQIIFWDSIGAFDMATDLAIMILPISLVYKLQLPREKKIAVCFAFSFRILAIGCAALRLYQLPKLFNREADITFESWLPTITTIIQLFFSVFAACVPHLRPFMESIQAGYFSGMIEDREDTRVGYGTDTYLLTKMSQTRENVSAQQKLVVGSPMLREESFDSRGEDMERRAEQRHSDAETVMENPAGGSTTPENANLNGRPTGPLVSGPRHNRGEGSRGLCINTTKEWSVVQYEEL